MVRRRIVRLVIVSVTVVLAAVVAKPPETPIQAADAGMAVPSFAPAAVVNSDLGLPAGTMFVATPDDSAISDPAEATTDPTQAPDPTTTPSPAPTAPPASPPPSCNSQTGVAAPHVYAGPRNRKVVALTFDDGWSSSNTLKILAILQRYHVSATFFPVGRVIQLYPSVWRTVARAGFPIADHTWDHHFMTKECYAAQVSELTRQDAIVRNVLGVDPLPVMRPPYGAWNRMTLLAAHATGQRDVVLWDVDTRDWAGPSPSVLAQRALAGRAGSIILMHASLGNTPAALPAIIAGYRARGFGFVTIGQLLGIGGSVPF